MTAMVRKRSEKAGLPPGALVYVGDKSGEDATITLMEYDGDTFSEQSLRDLPVCPPERDRACVTWIDVDMVHKVDLVAKLGECYNLHPLVVEDILNTDQRPKMEDYGEYLYIVLRAFACNGDSCGMQTEQVSLVLGSNYVLSFHESDGAFFSRLRERIRDGKGRARKSGADYLAYAILDTIVDNYFVVLEKVGERIEGIEEELVVHPAASTLRSIHRLKSDLINLRRSVWPLREVLSGLQREDTTLVLSATRLYLRDVYDHTIHMIDTLETFRDMISGMIDIYLSGVSNRLNEVMKVLTMIATIFIPLTFIAGVYGMNFQFMPELGWRWGYPSVLALMAAISIFMLVFFKRKKWL